MREVQVSIVIPTFNERDNLPILIQRIDRALNGTICEIIVVDDDSPDGTWKRAEELRDKYKNLRVLRRTDKRGLSSAVLDGFEIAKGNILGVIDADLSHPPEKIPELIEPIMNGEADMTIGSRYIDEGGIEKWSGLRKMYSKMATLLVLGLTSVKDPMSGFFFLRREVIENKELNPLGFKIGLEILVKGEHKSVVEVPIIFGDRAYGESKLGGGVVIEYLIQLFNLYVSKYILRK